MHQKILVAYDGTEAAEQAFKTALDLASAGHASLHVIAVASAAEVETHALHDRLRAECAAYLEPLPRRGAAVDVDVDVEVVDGIPAWVIPSAAERVGARLIVIGHRRRNLLRRCMQASVAKRVIDRAPCDVLVAAPGNLDGKRSTATGPA
jgi:nucleotide-binding universal stress UspA family protein